MFKCSLSNRRVNNYRLQVDSILHWVQGGTLYVIAYITYGQQTGLLLINSTESSAPQPPPTTNPPATHPAGQDMYRVNSRIKLRIKIKELDQLPDKLKDDLNYVNGLLPSSAQAQAQAGLS